MEMTALKLLDILASQDKIAWITDRRWVDGLINDIGLSKEGNPDWVSPRVKVLDKDTKEELAVISAGAWVEQDEVAGAEGQQ